MDLSRRRVVVRGNEVQPTPTEYELLRLPVSHAGKVLTQGQILIQIWSAACSKQQNVLRVDISDLSWKLEEDLSRPRYIYLGVGYRLKDD